MVLRERGQCLACQTSKTQKKACTEWSGPAKKKIHRYLPWFFDVSVSDPGPLGRERACEGVRGRAVTRVCLRFGLVPSVGDVLLLLASLEESTSPARLLDCGVGHDVGRRT